MKRKIKVTHYLHIWKAKKDQKFYWHLIAINKNIVASHNQGYNRRGSLLKSVHAIFKCRIGNGIEIVQWK